MAKYLASEINDIYTQTVKGYLDCGFSFCPISGANEGRFSNEITHVDLFEKSDKKSFIRIWMLNDSELTTDKKYAMKADTVSIVIKKYANDSSTHWSDRGDLISERKFYQITGKKDRKVFYDSKEEYNAIEDMRWDRYIAGCKGSYNKKIDAAKLPVNVIDGIMKRVNANYGCKRATSSCIKEVRLYKSVVGYGDPRERMTAQIKWEYNKHSGIVYFK